MKANIKYFQNQPYIVTDQSFAGFKELSNGHFANIYNEVTRTQVGLEIPWSKNYEWPTYPVPDFKPMKHQKITTEFMLNEHRCWVLNGMRSGKTYSTLCSIDILFKTQRIERVVIFAPLSILDDTWKQELFWTMPNKRVFIGNTSIDEANAALMSGRYDIVVLNHDKVDTCSEGLKLFNPCCVVVDEAGGFRYSTTNRTKALTNLVGIPGSDKFSNEQLRRYFYILTATPTSQNKTDCWALARLVSPHLLPNRGMSFNSFRERVCVPVQAKGRMGVDWLPKRGCDKYISSLLEPAIKYATADCVDLPPIVYTQRRVAATEPQRKAIRDITKHKISIVEDVDDKSNTAIVADTPGARYAKVMQMFGGAVRDNDGTVRKVGADKRVKELTDILDELGPAEKVVVCVSFTGIQNYVLKKLRTKKIDGLLINGSCSGKERTEIVRKFRSDKSCRVLVAHPECIKYGLNLTCANTIVWYLPPMTADQWIQANQRTTGKKSSSKRKINIISLYGSSLEKMLYQRRTEQQTSDESITDVWKVIVDHVKTQGV